MWGHESAMTVRARRDGLSAADENEIFSMSKWDLKQPVILEEHLEKTFNVTNLS